MTNPYLKHVYALEEQFREGRKLPLGDMPASHCLSPPGGRLVLLFSPHPDDECIVGALPLRLMRESRMRILNVAVTQGSRRERRAGRWKELKNACAWLGWNVIQTVEGGLENINPKGRATHRAAWQQACGIIRNILAEQQPSLVSFPHEADWNTTHIGTHLLVMDALAGMPGDFSCRVMETEFWAPMQSPNLMVEVPSEILADLMAGTACHVGEVERNPYHLSLPAWMQDNVRRGGEIVGGQGGAAPDFTFATLYRVRAWEKGAMREVWEGGRVLSARDDPAAAVLG